MEFKAGVSDSNDVVSNSNCYSNSNSSTISCIALSHYPSPPDISALTRLSDNLESILDRPRSSGSPLYFIGEELVFQERVFCQRHRIRLSRSLRIEGTRQGIRRRIGLPPRRFGLFVWRQAQVVA
ncbi:unnamed protein product [Prunus brigantina]